jgi:hypothetical protein
MTGIGATLLSIGVLAAFALLGGGAWLLLKRRDVKKGLLMLCASAVVFGNVLIWTLPPPG